MNSRNKASPANRKTTKIANEIKAALPACTFFPWLFKPTTTGMEPVISITANSTMKAVRICCKSK